MPLHYLHLKGFSKLDHRPAGDSVKETIRDRRMDRAFLVDKEDVGACRLGNVAAVIKHQRVGEALLLGSML